MTRIRIFWNISETIDPEKQIKCSKNAKTADKPDFTGFLLHTITTTDKVIKYGENNKKDFSEHPTVIQRGEERTINIYAAIPNVA